MNTKQAFLDALDRPDIKTKYPDSTIRTWRSRANREAISLDFMVEFLNEHGYHLVQIMIWSGPGENNRNINNGTSHVADHYVRETENPKNKTELGSRLYHLRKEMNKDIFNRWFEWCSNEYQSDYPNRKVGLTPAVFSQMSSGRYVSKENVLFAIKALRYGRELMQEYESLVKRELETLQ